MKEGPDSWKPSRPLLSDWVSTDEIPDPNPTIEEILVDAVPDPDAISRDENDVKGRRELPPEELPVEMGRAKKYASFKGGSEKGIDYNPLIARMTREAEEKEQRERAEAERHDKTLERTERLDPSEEHMTSGDIYKANKAGRPSEKM